jgi:leucyl aminopeptidase
LLETDLNSKDLIKEVRVLGKEDLKKLGMNLFYAVGQGSTPTDEPRCVVVNYKGNPDSEEIDVALVGKGLTYDTGGLNLKPTKSIEDMYLDKSGACAVIGALHASLKLKPRKNIIFAVGLCENAVDAKSYKPNDIIKSMKGLTVEIGNTDAEGRLVLADTFTYVQREFKPKKLIDLATLTGACMVALGNDTAGLFSNCDTFAKQIEESSKRVFEPVWRLPINEEHRESMKSQYADLNNSGKTRYGGASTAAAFLERFIEKDTKWVHLDIAGPAIKTSAKAPDCANGNGFGVQLLIDYLMKH